MVRNFTNRGPNGNSIIDYIWLNCPRREVECKVVENLNSDHNMIMARIRGNNLRIKEGGNRGRLWKNYIKDKLIKCLENIDWSELYRNENINEVVHIFSPRR